MSNTRTIAKNTAWFGIDNGLSAAVALITSIAIARALGPSKTGYIVYVSYIASVVASLGSLGIGAATRKYMAEYLGREDKGTARYIFTHALFLQTGLATVSTAAIVSWVLNGAEPQYKTAALLIALSIWPSMVNVIPAQANSATEDLATNLPGSMVSAFAYLVAILGAVILRWGVVGIGAALLLMRSVDFLVRFFPALRRILAWPTVQSISADLRNRMIAFSWKSVANMLLALIVWERVEVLLLKSLCNDIRQVAFYSIAFSMGNELLISATVFGAAASTTIFAQYGRDKSKLPALAANSFRYLAISSIPLHVVVCSLALSALRVFYGRAYEGAAAVVTIAPLLCLPKAFVAPIQNFLFSSERQNYVVFATIAAAILDISVAAALIPSYGAVGACIGSGVAQLTAVGSMWAIGIRLYKIRIPWLLTTKVILSSIAAGAAARLVAVNTTPLYGLVLGGVLAAVVLIGLFYLLRVFEHEDLRRVELLVKGLPRPLARRLSYCMSTLVRGDCSPEAVEI